MVNRKVYMKKTTILIGIRGFLQSFVQLSIMSIVLGGFVQGLVAFQGLSLLSSLMSWGWNSYSAKTQERMIRIQTVVFKRIVALRCITVIIDLVLTCVVLYTNSVGWFFVLLLMDILLFPLTQTIDMIDNVSDNIIMHDNANISDVQYLQTKRGNTANISALIGQGASMLVLTTMNLEMLPLWLCAISLHLAYVIEVFDKAYWQRIVKKDIRKHFKKQLKKLNTVE